MVVCVIESGVHGSAVSVPACKGVRCRRKPEKCYGLLTHLHVYTCPFISTRLPALQRFRCGLGATHIKRKANERNDESEDDGPQEQANGPEGGETA
jgi:hypothetical protein